MPSMPSTIKTPVVEPADIDAPPSLRAELRLPGGRGQVDVTAEFGHDPDHRSTMVHGHGRGAVHVTVYDEKTGLPAHLTLTGTLSDVVSLLDLAGTVSRHNSNFRP